MLRLICLSLLLFSTPALAKSTGFLTVMSDVAGELLGGVTEAGREGSMLVIGYSHEVVSPRDAASGLPTGKRQHKPFVVTKPIDKATPLLMQALVNNENLSRVRMELVRRPGEATWYTVELVNASVCDIRTAGGTHEPSLKGAPNKATRDLEHVSFCYQKIIWTITDGGITAEDDWEAPNAG